MPRLHSRFSDPRLSLLVLLLPISAAHSGNGCQLLTIAELPITMERSAPIVVSKINGVDVRLVADSGAYYSMLSPAAVSQLNLTTHSAPFGFWLEAVGGIVHPGITSVPTFTLGDYPVHNLPFLVYDSNFGNTMGLFGQNIMRIGDVEFDLANGVMRLFKAENCSGPLAYWAKNTPFGVIDIKRPTPEKPSPAGVAFINGIKVRVMFDTGAYNSMISKAAADRAGITFDSAESKPRSVYGLGHRVVRSWLGAVNSFKLGDEEIQHTQLLVSADLVPGTDMLIGADFFLSHRVFVANNQDKLYFTYNGGPVFAIGSTSWKQPDATGAAVETPTSGGKEGPAPSAALSQDATDPFSDEPKDAAGFLRRAMASVARKDYQHAISDLKQACDLAPGLPDYPYQLGRVQWQSGHADLALAAFSRSLDIKPDFVAALFARARLRMQLHTDPSVDLDFLDQTLPTGAGQRLALAYLYDEGFKTTSALHDFDLWISAHGNDPEQAEALNGRCWARAKANENLDKALTDCNAALRLQPKNAGILDSRGMVRLRRGELDLALADYDAALALEAGKAESLYGRGIVKLRKGLQEQSAADMAAATAIEPRVAETFHTFGVQP